MSFKPSQSPTDSLARLFEQTRSEGSTFADVFSFLRAHAAASISEKVAVCVMDQSARWNTGERLTVEDYLNQLPELETNAEAKESLVASEYQLRVNSGVTPSLEEYQSRFPDLGIDFMVPRDIGVTREHNGESLPTKTKSEDFEATATLSDGDGHATLLDPSRPVERPLYIGKYRVLQILGDGGFGRVYLAADEALDRHVALKVPHEFRLEKPEDIEAYSTEAKILAKLVHPAIVPVHDFDWIEDGRCYTVTGYIEGSDLAKKLKRDRFSFSATAALIAVVAEALHYSHTQGFIHRDVKPANILLDNEGKPYVTDFGIALREEDWGKDGATAGTPAYMSPEQVRGEGHLVDGRSDVFSLGVVLFEMLSGQRPFGRTWQERRQLTEAPSLRRVDRDIPTELERICQKAMSHRVSDRYRSADLMQQDLRYYVEHGIAAERKGAGNPRLSGSDGSVSSEQSSETGFLEIIPRGLRSFDGDDAGFFSELLPGQRGRDGVPESIRFWKQRIQGDNAQDPFRVGLIYGPSGCGKSSFLKAGVLPCLPDRITRVYIEATPEETEVRLLATLRRKCPELPRNLSLPESMAALRRSEQNAAGEKILIVIDQFEQWLHSRRDDGSSELVEALRQCDGTHLQCIVSARDDFWMAVTHFMNDVEVTLVPDKNVAALDLFSIRHTEKVLTAMGRAYGMLPKGHERISRTQKQFIRNAVKDLAQDSQVIPVHLALFAEMIKDKPWEPSLLRELGGTEGVGVTFLEDTFNGRKANPQHRLHQKGARAVLAALLADEGGALKGGMRSYEELLEASEYGNRREDFEALLRILDSELRLITPTEPAGISDTQQVASAEPSLLSSRFFQLTHDYLVPSITEWVHQKRKASVRGRAELLLTERAMIWQAKPSSRSLPSLLEWARILCLTSRRRRTHLQTEQKMMKRAGRFHLQRLSVAAVLIVAAVLWIRDYVPRSQAHNLVQSLQSAATEDTKGIIGQLTRIGPWSEPILKSALETADAGSRGEMHIRLALLQYDKSQTPALIEYLKSSPPETLRVIAGNLDANTEAGTLTNSLWPVVEKVNESREKRFRAAAALAITQSKDASTLARLSSVADTLSTQLIRHVTDDRELASAWQSAFKPIRDVLLGSLTEIYADADRRDSERETAASILKDFTLGRTEQLIELLLIATPQQHRILFPALEQGDDDAKATAKTILREHFETVATEPSTYESRSLAAERRAHAAALLMALGSPELTLSTLAQVDDRELSSFLENRLSVLALCPDVLHGKMTGTSSALLRAAILRIFGGVSATNQLDIVSPSRTRCLEYFEDCFRTDPDQSVHSAAEWALRTWGSDDRLKQITGKLAGKAVSDDRGWYVSRRGHHMAVFRGPIRFEMGSPPGEPNRDASDESITVQRIGRDFAIGTKEVTMGQFLEFHPGFRHAKNAYTLTPDCPATGIVWHRMAEYCNWLSQKEGVPKEEWCYEETKPNFFRPAANYLSRTGYRLPTEAEWEYACRAGSNTAFSWGNSPTLADRYAWHSGNRSEVNSSVGYLCPNVFGMFDMHGSVSEVTQSLYVANLLPESDDSATAPETPPFSDDVELVVRNNAFTALIRMLRSANKRPSKAQSHLSFLRGFRLARTLD